jgi:SAM-dependent methyltransferase
MTSLCQSYNQEQAEQRDLRKQEAWKLTLRQQFLSLLQQEGKTELLEIGAGTGQDSLFFHNNGLSVVCTDLSADTVYRCRAKGLMAYVMDFLSLDFPAHSFDAVYALNPIEPKWVHAKRNVVETDGLLSARQLAERICAYFHCSYEPHLSIRDSAPGYLVIDFCREYG